MKPSELMTTWFQRVWCDEDGSAIDELLHPDGKVHGIGPDPLVGRDAFRGFWKGVTTAFGKNHIRVIDAVDQDDTCYVRCEGDLTFNGKPVRLTGGCQCRVSDGQIVEAWNYWDFIGCLADMEALPANAFEAACGGERYGPTKAHA